MKRSLADILAFPFRPQFHRAFWQSLSVFENPVDVLLRYVFAKGPYPARIGMRTPTGPIEAELWSFDDVRTLVECFAKTDYPARAGHRVVVDVGSNIGLSALYFLTRDPDTHVYMVEPLPQNITRLRRNLAPFAGRCSLLEAAAGLEDGAARFGYEETGRYGGLGLDLGGGSLTVPVVELNRHLRGIIGTHGRIDVLKLDVEGMERPLLDALPADILANTGAIYAETFGDAPDFRGFRRREWGGITQYTRAAA